MFAYLRKTEIEMRINFHFKGQNYSTSETLIFSRLCIYSKLRPLLAFGAPWALYSIMQTIFFPHIQIQFKLDLLISTKDQHL